MNGYFAAGKLTEEERENILSQHRHVYDGYRTMQPEVKNEQPLYVQDFAKDKVGVVLNNKGVAKPYTNFGINEQTEQKEVCDECGSMMMEGECSECGWKGEVGDMDEENDQEEPSFMDRVQDTAKDVGMFVVSNPEILAALEEHGEDGDPQYSRIDDPHSPKSHRKSGRFKRHQYGESKEECKECGGMMYEGECSECGYKGNMDEETGHLDDIYHEEDLNPSAEFDYVKGASNKTNAFHVKEQAEDYINYDDNEDPDNEDDGYEDINASEVTDGELDELGTHELERGKKYKYNTPNFDDEIEFDDDFEDKAGGNKMYKFKGKDKTSHLMPGKHIEDFVKDLEEQGGNAYDMDDDDVKPAFDFEPEGPGMGNSYPVNEDGDGECDECWEQMESAWSEEIDETDVSGAQGIYGAMKPAFDFDSEGPGKAGPYQHSQYENKAEDEDAYWDKDLDDDELDLDFEKFNPRDKSWEEITAHTGDDEFGGVDEDIKESLITQKNKIMEMMNRMKVFK
jgi:hypothetical protein